MSALLGLVAVVGALYLFESIRSTPRAAVLFVGRRSGRVAIRGGAFELARDLALRWGAFLPWSLEAVGQPWPVSLAKQGVRCEPPHVIAPDRLGKPEVWERAWKEVGLVEANGASVSLGRARFRCASSVEAIWWREIVSRLADTPAEQVEANVRMEMATWLDVERVEERRKRGCAATQHLRLAGSTLFLFVFALLPLGARFQAPITSLGVIVAYLVLVVWCQIEAALALRRLRPEGTPYSVWSVVFFPVHPTGAMRASTEMLSSLMAPFHPLALAAALCDRDQLEAFAARNARGLVHPLLERSSARVVDEEIHDLLGVLGFEDEELLRPPRSAAPGERSWCPHCGAMWRLEAGTCPDCASVELIGLAGGQP